MKRIILILFAVMLCGCKSHKAVTEVTRIDTTTTVCDSVQVKTIAIDTTKTDGQSIIYELVQFVDSGGVICIDSTGNVSLQGVKSYRYANAHQHRTIRGITQRTDSTHESLNQINGIEEHTKQEQPAAKEAKPYLVIAYRAITLCCIAALLYLIFLYIKKKT